MLPPNRKSSVARAVVATMSLVAAGSVMARDSRPVHAVFVMTNDDDRNEVLSFERSNNGALRDPRHFDTGGRGSGGLVDPLASQGSLTLSDDKSWLFAVNAGSGTVSVFGVEGSRLVLTDTARTQGAEPNAVAQHGNLVYVLNAAGSSSVVGFRFAAGHLFRIDDSLQFLSGNGVGPASLAFSPDGKFLIATERSTNLVDVFSVLPNGKLSVVTENSSAGPGAFAATFAPNGIAIVSETGPGTANGSAASSYSIRPDHTLAAITTSIPTLGNANCWNVVTPNGRFVYMSNSGSSTLAGFAIAPNGALTPIGATIVGSNPTGSANLDIAVSADGAYLFTLNAATGSIGTFAIDAPTGTLTSLGTTDGLPASTGLNGIAAN